MHRPNRFSLVTSLILAAPLSAANIAVDTTADSDVDDADCSLREAIVAANSDAAHQGCAAGTGRNDRIVFSVATPATITLVADLPEITESVAIVGPGVDLLTIDGVDDYRLLSFPFGPDSDPVLVVSGLTLTDGASFGGNGGGAIAVEGRLDLSDCELSSSTTDWVGGGLSLYGYGRVERCRILDNVAAGNAGGGGVYVTRSILFAGEFELVDSTLAGNVTTAESSGGGGLKSQELPSLVVRRSTISGNSTGSSGGGIEATPGFDDESTSYVSITSVTITDNECNAVSTANFGCGGGLRIADGFNSTMDFTITNSVVAANRDLAGTTFNDDVVVQTGVGLVFTSGGFNLVGENPGAASVFPAGTPNGNGDFVGTDSSPLPPGLEALGDNGGATPTHALTPALVHPLADKGSCTSEVRDQRGFGNSSTGLRRIDFGPIANGPNSDGCDIGAFEAGVVELPRLQIFVDGFESGTLLFWSADAT